MLRAFYFISAIFLAISAQPRQGGGGGGGNQVRNQVSQVRPQQQTQQFRPQQQQTQQFRPQQQNQLYRPQQLNQNQQYRPQQQRQQFPPQQQNQQFRPQQQSQMNQPNQRIQQNQPIRQENQQQQPQNQQFQQRNQQQSQARMIGNQDIRQSWSDNWGQQDQTSQGHTKQPGGPPGSPPPGTWKPDSSPPPGTRPPVTRPPPGSPPPGSPPPVTRPPVLPPPTSIAPPITRPPIGPPPGSPPPITRPPVIPTPNPPPSVTQPQNPPGQVRTLQRAQQPQTNSQQISNAAAASARTQNILSQDQNTAQNKVFNSNQSEQSSPNNNGNLQHSELESQAPAAPNECPNTRNVMAFDSSKLAISLDDAINDFPNLLIPGGLTLAQMLGGGTQSAAQSSSSNVSESDSCASGQCQSCKYRIVKQFADSGDLAMQELLYETVNG